MKKVILMLAVLGFSVPGICQEKYVTTASMALGNNNLDEAKENIDKAMQNADTKEKPKALYIKARTYMALQAEVTKFEMSKGAQGSDKYKADNPYKEGTAALLKLVEVKGDYERENTDQMLLMGANFYYNAGVKAYSDSKNEKRYAESGELMKNVIKIHDLEDGKRFEKFPRKKSFDTMAANANLILANGAYTQRNFEEAVPLLTKVKNNPITKTPSAYACLINAYNQQKKTTEAFAMIEEGRKAFPNDVTLRNSELNYYVSSGKQDELIKKLEEAAASDPTNADIQFNLATAYLSMANPKDGKKPANYAELNKKSEAAFQNGLKIQPDNVVFNYNFGAFYFNQAKDVNDQMNALGNSSAEQKKYDELKPKRDDYFAKALPYFEKAYNLALPNESSLKGEDLGSYRSTVLALNQIYAAQSKNDKAAEMNKKYEELNKK